MNKDGGHLGYPLPGRLPDEIQSAHVCMKFVFTMLVVTIVKIVSVAFFAQPLRN